MAGVVTSEGSDRPGLSLPNNQDALISTIATASPRTIVVLKDGDPVLMPWIDQVPAVLEAWNPGEEDGNIVARLLFGLANPSGKLPVTYPRLAGDTPTSTSERYPGVVENGIPTAHYSEGLGMGYRWYEAQNIQPLFPFGFGLSYTDFRLSKLDVNPKSSDGTRPIRVQLEVQNTGQRGGAEVPQVYLGLPTSTGEPPRRLVGFQKVWLEQDEKKKIEITIDPATSSHPLGIWDPEAQRWKTVDGPYQVNVGQSSADSVLSQTITVRTRHSHDH
jgi:beta-glucosidase